MGDCDNWLQFADYAQIHAIISQRMMDWLLDRLTRDPQQVIEEAIDAIMNVLRSIVDVLRLAVSPGDLIKFIFRRK